MAFAGRSGGVLIIVQNLPVPFDRRVWLEATTLQRAGYRVSVICPKAKGFTHSQEVLEGIDIHRYGIPVQARSALGFVFEFAWCWVRTLMKSLRIAIRGPGFDVIHACNPPDTYWLLGLLYRPFGKRFVFDHHDLSPEMYEAKFARNDGFAMWGLRWLEQMTFRAADIVIATNESHKQIAVKRGGVPPEKVYVVRSGPELARLKAFPPDATWKRGKRFLIVYLGEICAQDGVEYLVRALVTLRDDLGRNDIHCVLVGGGPHQEAVKAYARDVGASDLCTFTGRVSDEDLCRILSSADLAVDPDPKTAWSDQSTMNKIMEYMFFGLPIVGFALTENRVSAGKALLTVENNDPVELARVVARLLDAPELREEMSRVGQERLRTQLAWSYSVAPLLAAYDAALKGR